MFRDVLTRLRGLAQRRRVARELDDELRFHVEMESDAHVRRGVPPEEARRRAMRDLGGVTQTHEAVRDVRTLSVESLWQDVRYALRTLAARPGFAFAAVGMLAVGIGITTAMFTVLDALILRPVPFRDPHQLAFVYMGSERGGRIAVHPAVLRAWRESRAFEAAESATASTVVLDEGGLLTTRAMARVTPGIFDMLGGVRPIRGRLFDPTEGGAGTDDRVLISETLWRGAYGADPALIGRAIQVDGRPHTVVGILPADFRFPAWNTAIWIPIDFDNLPAARRSAQPQAHVRFAADLPREDALRIARDAAHAADPTTAKLEPRPWSIIGRLPDIYSERAVRMLTGGVLLVFVVLAANVCSLLLARLTARRREFTMRAALGASRGRLVRQAIVESSVMGVLGVCVGLALAWTLVSLARTFLPEAFLIRTLNPMSIDVRAVAVTSLAGLFAVLASGLIPAWLGTRVNEGESLRAGDRTGTESAGARAVSRSLLVVEVALACTLLVGATLLVRSFMNLAATDRGLETEGVVTAVLSLSEEAFPDRAGRAAIGRSIEDRLRELPGIEQMVWSFGLPPAGGSFHFGDWQPDVPDATPINMRVESYHVGQEFFQFYGIPLLRGRTFSPGDPDGAVIVGERLAESLWPGLDPVGRTFSRDKRRYEVIGLVRETHYPSLDAERDAPEFYEPFPGIGGFAMLSIRCGAGCPGVAAIRQRLGSVHPGVQAHTVATLEDTYLEQLARPRAAAALAFAFAAIAVLAAAGGLFSVLTYAVGRRRREFGIRTALGASPARIRGVVLRDGLVVALTGLTIGGVFAVLLARGLASLHYGVSAGDPITWAIVFGLVGLTTLAASWRPAIVASRVDPVLLLREE